MKPKPRKVGKQNVSSVEVSSKKGESKGKVVRKSANRGKASASSKKREDGAGALKTKKGSASLTAYFKSYKGGLGDFHIPVFRALKNFTSAKKLLYPGCHRHVTASLIFSDVVYVDNYSKVAQLFSDEKVLQFVKENKEYEETSSIKFKCKNFEGDIGEKPGSFDLLMSLSAGIVSKPCEKYLKRGGYFLASDAHFDARMSFIDPKFEFIAVYDDSKKVFDDTDSAKSGHFVTQSGSYITPAMVQDSIDKPKAKRSFKLQKETLFYLFRKK